MACPPVPLTVTVGIVVVVPVGMLVVMLTTHDGFIIYLHAAIAHPTCEAVSMSLLLLLLAACVGGPEPLDPACVDTCEVLVGTCGIEAFPDLGSCQEGCRYAAQEGADVTSYAQCVDLAACDTFALISCEHDFGLD